MSETHFHVGAIAPHNCIECERQRQQAFSEEVVEAKDQAALESELLRTKEELRRLKEVFTQEISEARTALNSSRELAQRYKKQLTESLNAFMAKVKDLTRVL